MSQRNFALKFFYGSPMERTCFNCKWMCFNNLCCLECCYGKFKFMDGDDTAKGKYLLVDEAPDPDNINWENICRTIKKKL